MWFPQGRAAQALLFSAWILLAGFGFKQLLVYSNTAGLPATPTREWPSNSSVHRDPAFASLVIFAHPHCPCSTATLGELERLIPHTKGKIKNFVVFVKPAGLSDDWAKEDLWKKSESIPEVLTLLDVGGYEAAKFGAKDVRADFPLRSKWTPGLSGRHHTGTWAYG